MLTDPDVSELYKTPPSPETAAFLAAMAEKVQTPKRARKKAAQKPKASSAKATPTPQHNAHVQAARPASILRDAFVGMGHDPQPLSYFASRRFGRIADVCRCATCHPAQGSNPPLGPQGWGIAPDGPQATSMGPGIRRA